MRQKTHLVIMNSILGLKLNESKFRPTVTKATIPDIPKYSTGEREKKKKPELKVNAFKSAHWCALSKDNRKVESGVSHLESCFREFA